MLQNPLWFFIPQIGKDDFVISLHPADSDVATNVGNGFDKHVADQHEPDCSDYISCEYKYLHQFGLQVQLNDRFGRRAVKPVLYGFLFCIFLANA
jgi:hypothetical protein